MTDPAFRPMRHMIIPPVYGVRLISQYGGGLDIEMEPGKEAEVVGYLKAYLDHLLSYALANPIASTIPQALQPPTLQAPPPMASLTQPGSAMVPGAVAGCEACAWQASHPTTVCFLHGKKDGAAVAAAGEAPVVRRGPPVQPPGLSVEASGAMPMPGAFTVTLPPGAALQTILEIANPPQNPPRDAPPAEGTAAEEGASSSST